MTSEFPDPADDFENMDMDNIEYGFTDEDLGEVIDDVRGDVFEYSGYSCRVRKTQVDEDHDQDKIVKSRQEFWVAGVYVEWEKHHFDDCSDLFDPPLMFYNDGWIEVRVGHERTVTREKAEDEAEWIAEQLIMFRSDPSNHI